jgi:hypothetical protein
MKSYKQELTRKFFLKLGELSKIPASDPLAKTKQMDGIMELNGIINSIWEDGKAVGIETQKSETDEKD